MGVVYRAVDELLDRAVALKFLNDPLSGDDEANARFVHEARAASALDHPNICTIYEISLAPDGSRFIAMAYYPGQTVKDQIAGGPLPPDKAVAVARQVAAGLVSAHEAGIIHRDIKPANVMVTDRGLVKLLDFGVAKLAGQAEATRTGMLMGTMAYMSPEQMTDDPVDHRADLWALGVLLYEMLTGRRPFQASHEAALLYAVLSTDPRPIQDVAPSLPAALIRIVDRCLQRRPADRYPDAVELLADLRALDSGKPSPLSLQLWPEGTQDLGPPMRTGPAARPGAGPSAPIGATLTSAGTGRERGRQLILLQKVRQFWIEGVLEQSIHRQGLMVLGKAPQPEAVQHPWEQVLELPARSGQTVEPDRRIGDLFRDVGGSLLILGEPGAGKTVTLLELAQSLIEGAEAEPEVPVPVVLNLSSWHPRHSLVAWLSEELGSKYQVPRRLGRRWVEDNQLILLLDGLDEVLVDYRAACVNAINAFVEEYGVPGLVVCSRIGDYTALPVRLRLYAAIALRPLSPEQVQRHLAQSGPALAGLAGAIRNNPTLLAMAQSPLMLDVMSLASRDLSEETLAGLLESDERTERTRLFSAYVDRMFQRRGRRDESYSRDETVTWLSSLARVMRRQGQTVFLIEEIQPSWLPVPSERWRYVFATRLSSGIALAGACGLVGGVVAWLLVLFRSNPDGTVRLGPMLRMFFGAGDLLGPVQSTLSAMIFGAGAGLFLTVLDGRRIARPAGEPRPVTDRSLGRVVLRGIQVGLGTAILGGALIAPIWGVREGIEVGLLLGPLFGIVWGTRDRSSRPDHDIHPVEALGWSARRAGKGGLVGLAVGLGVGPLLAAIFGLVGKGPSRPGDIISVGVAWALSYSVIGVFFGGLVSDVVPGKTVLNQGIALSRKNALSMGLTFGVIAALSQGLLSGLFEDAFAGLAIGILLGGSLGLTAGMWYGGLDVIHHYTLRLMLFRTGSLPLRLQRFLKHAHQLVFLQRVGGGVIFVHRLLLDHFASLDSGRPDPS